MMSRDFSIHFGLYVCSLVLNNHTHDYICVSYQKSCTYDTYRGARGTIICSVREQNMWRTNLLRQLYVPEIYGTQNNVPDLPIRTYDDSFYVPVKSWT